MQLSMMTSMVMMMKMRMMLYEMFFDGGGENYNEDMNDKVIIMIDVELTIVM